MLKRFELLLLVVCAFLISTAIVLPYAALAQDRGSSNLAGVVAYVQDGNLWVKELPGGEAQQLAAGQDVSYPQWSPSGQWLAYLVGDQLWVVQRSGAGARWLEKAGPITLFAWSPTSDTLAYRSHTGSLWLASASSWTEREILFRPEGGEGSVVLGMAWSPDGERIAYGLRKGAAYQGLWKIAVSGQEPTELYVSGMPEKGEAILAGWSVDGRYLFFWQGDILSASLLSDGVPFYALPAEGGPPVRLADAVLVYRDFFAAQPVDGQGVALITGFYRSAWTNKALHLASSVGGEGEPLTSPDQAVSSPSWSPDGRHIAFVAMSDEGDLVAEEPIRQGLMGRRIWVGGLDGGFQVRQFTHDLAYRDERPLWSADGSQILFARLDENDEASLWLMAADGSGVSRVVEELSPAPAWDGYYGHIGWDRYFDWWTGPAPPVLPDTGAVRLAPLLLMVAGAVVLVAGLGKYLVSRLG